MASKTKTTIIDSSLIPALESMRDFLLSYRESITETIRLDMTNIFENAISKSKKQSTSKTAVENVAFKLIGIPTKDQEAVLWNNINSSRFLWNRMTADLNDALKNHTLYSAKTPGQYKKDPDLEWLKGADSYALCNVQQNHNRACKDFFSGNKGKPHFKKKYLCKDSYTTNKKAGTNNVQLEGNQLTLPKVPGTIPLRGMRDIPDNYILKSVTVTHEKNGKWSFSILFEYLVRGLDKSLDNFDQKLQSEGLRYIGLDMSLPELYIDSNNERPHYVVNDVVVTFSKKYAELESRIAKEQRKLSRKEKHSNNYAKQAQRVAELYAKATQQRHDFLRQIAVRLARSYDVISIEDLDMSAIKQSLKFGKSVSDNAWSAFIGYLEEKCHQYGCVLVRVNKWFPSSKTCHECGHVHKELKLSDRTYICPICGNVIDRDYQAALNIDAEGLRILNELFSVESK